MQKDLLNIFKATLERRRAEFSWIYSIRPQEAKWIALQANLEASLRGNHQLLRCVVKHSAIRAKERHRTGVANRHLATVSTSSSFRLSLGRSGSRFEIDL